MSQEIKPDKEEMVMCERCGKPLGTGECPRCSGIKLAKKEGINIAA